MHICRKITVKLDFQDHAVHELRGRIGRNIRIENIGAAHRRPDILVKGDPHVLHGVDICFPRIIDQHFRFQMPRPDDAVHLLRERLGTVQKKTVFIMQIGDKLASGKPHDSRAPDYDDWTLNGDILFWDDVLDCAMEISSMGIRVDEKALDEQLKKAGADERRSLPFHKALLAGELPLTMGGGIGQSRLSMLLLGKAHIGEVQVSLWDDETRRVCAENGIVLL